jgi:hypothetical protein
MVLSVHYKMTVPGLGAGISDHGKFGAKFRTSGGACSSGVEHLPFKQRVDGSNPSTLTEPPGAGSKEPLWSLP